MMEYGDSEAIFEDPKNPYTKALLSAVPDPDPDTARDRIFLQGSPPSPADPPSGCPFQTCCPMKVGAACEQTHPEFYSVGDGTAPHQSACLIHDADVDSPASYETKAQSRSDTTQQT